MNTTIGLIITGFGSAVAVIAFFLPWLRADFINTALPIIEMIIGFFNQQLKKIVQQLHGVSSLTAYTAVFDLGFLSTEFRLVMLLPLIMATIAILGIIITLATQGRAGRVMNAIVAIAGAIVAGLLVLNITNLSRLGFGGDWPVGAAIAFLGFSPSTGFWLSLGGVLLIVVGAVIAAVASTLASNRQVNNPPYV
jgi:hypothetical protein